MSNSLSQVTVIGRPQPKSWADYRQGCLDNYGGGHRSDGHLEAFRHGMETVFNLLEAEFPPAEQCKAAPELIKACRCCVRFLDDMSEDYKSYGVPDMAKQVRSAIAKAQADN